MLFTKSRAVENGRIVLRVRLDARKLDDVEILQRQTAAAYRQVIVDRHEVVAIRIRLADHGHAVGKRVTRGRKRVATREDIHRRARARLRSLERGVNRRIASNKVPFCVRHRGDIEIDEIGEDYAKCSTS